MNNENLQLAANSKFYKEILNRRKNHGCSLSLKSESKKFIEEMLEFLFPHFSEKIYFTEEELDAKLILLQRNLKSILKSMNTESGFNITEVAEKFMSFIPEVHAKLWQDAEAINSGDPAAESVDEVILAYPGFYAIAIYRIAHEFYKLKIPIFPRILTEYAHQVTAIDIHPGAEIGNSFCIDHGTGIVIGETTTIGNNVKLYQGVTLGALSVDKKMAKQKRHPTVEDNVIIYAQAVILGGETRIGHNSVIGGNAWLTSSVEPYSIVSHKNEIRFRSNKENPELIDFVI